MTTPKRVPRTTRVTITVAVDTDTWAEEYGIDPADVAKDVKAMFTEAVQSLSEQLGLAPRT